MAVSEIYGTAGGNMCFNQLIISLPLNPSGVAYTPDEDDRATDMAYVSYSSKAFDDDEVTYESLNLRQFVGLHFNLGTTFHYNIGNTTGTLKTKQYNLVFLPRMKAECIVEQGKYAALDISFPVSYLLRFQDHFPILRPFLRDAKRRTLSAVGAQHLECTPEMLNCIQDILYNRWTGVGRNIYLHAKIFDVLLFCLKHLTDHQRVMREEEAKKIEMARDYLLEHLEDRFSADVIAEKVHMDKNKLRKGFKLLYKTTMVGFVLHERLERALTLLRETDMSIKNIATAVGYKKPSAFTDVFRRKFGCHPTAFRKVSYLLEKHRNGIKKLPLA